MNKIVKDCSVYLKDKDFRIDDIGFGDLKLCQEKKGFCYGIDSILLCDFVVKRSTNMEKSLSICDLGTGNGIIPIILSFKLPDSRLTGVELQPDVYKLARYNCKINGLDNRINFFEGDVRRDDLLKGEKFQTVVSNPPYMKADSALLNADSGKAIARHEVSGTLQDFLYAGYRLLEKGGSYFMINRANRLADIIYYGRHIGLEPKIIRMIHPFEDREANLVLCHIKKNGGRELKVMEPLIVRNKDGNLTQEVNDMYD